LSSFAFSKNEFVARIEGGQGSYYKHLPDSLRGFRRGWGRARRPPVGSPIRWFGFRTVQGDGNSFQRAIHDFGAARGKSAIPLLVKQTPEHLRKSAANTQVKGLYNRQGIATGFITSKEQAVS
jgi:hypothetical protein